MFLKNSFWSVKKMEFNAMIDGKETSVLLKSTNRTDTSYQVCWLCVSDCLLC